MGTIVVWCQLFIVLVHGFIGIRTFAQNREIGQLSGRLRGCDVDPAQLPNGLLLRLLRGLAIAEFMISSSERSQDKHYAKLSRSAFASIRSGVLNPSVNQE